MAQRVNISIKINAKNITNNKFTVKLWCDTTDGRKMCLGGSQIIVLLSDGGGGGACPAVITQLSPSLWDGAYKRTLAVNRKE